MQIKKYSAKQIKNVNILSDFMNKFEASSKRCNKNAADAVMKEKFVGTKKKTKKVETKSCHHLLFLCFCF